MNVQEVYNKISELKTDLSEVSNCIKDLELARPMPATGLVRFNAGIAALKQTQSALDRQLQELYRLEVVQPVVATEATPEDQELTGEALVGKLCEFSPDGKEWVAIGRCVGARGMQKPKVRRRAKGGSSPG